MVARPHVTKTIRRPVYKAGTPCLNDSGERAFCEGWPRRPGALAKSSFAARAAPAGSRRFCVSVFLGRIQLFCRLDHVICGLRVAFFACVARKKCVFLYARLFVHRTTTELLLLHNVVGFWIFLNRFWATKKQKVGSTLTNFCRCNKKLPRAARPRATPPVALTCGVFDMLCKIDPIWSRFWPPAGKLLAAARQIFGRQPTKTWPAHALPAVGAAASGWHGARAPRVRRTETRV